MNNASDRKEERERERACKALIGMQLDLQWGRFVFLDAGPLKANKNYRPMVTEQGLSVRNEKMELTNRSEKGHE